MVLGSTTDMRSQYGCQHRDLIWRRIYCTWGARLRGKVARPGASVQQPGAVARESVPTAAMRKTAACCSTREPLVAIVKR